MKGDISIKQSAIIFLSALTIRLVVLLVSYRNGTLLGADTQLYIKIARNLSSGNGFAAEHGATAFVSPMFPLFLAGCSGVFGENFLWASFVHCVLSSIVCVLIAKTTARLFGNSTGFIAGLVAAFYFELILYASPQLLTEPLYIFFLAAGVCFLINGLISENKALLYACLAGLFFGLAGLTRPLALPLAVSATLIILIYSFIKRQRTIIFPIVFIAVCLLTMLPWGIRNQMAMNHFTLLSLEGGHVFWLGNNPDYDRFEHPDFTRFGGYTVMFNQFPAEVSGKNEVEADKIFYETAWRHIFEHPLNFLIRGFHKMWNMWRPTFSGSSWKNWLVSLTFYPLLLILSLSGIYQAVRSNSYTDIRLPIMVLIWIFLTHLAIHFLVNAEIRFRLPIWILLIPFAALSVQLIVKKFREFKTEMPREPFRL